MKGRRMTKDHVVIAEALASIQPKATDPLRYHNRDEWRGQLNQWHECVTVVWNALQANDPRFDFVRFVEACLGHECVNVLRMRQQKSSHD